MKKIILVMIISVLAIFSAKAQTANELLGKWKLIKWTKNGTDKVVTDSTYQVFEENDVFVSITEGKEHKGKWKLSKDNKILTIRSGIFKITFKIDYFDTKKRVITTDQLGTLEYTKVE